MSFGEVILPPASIGPALHSDYRIFLAGSIEMGLATQWQNTFIRALNDTTSKRNVYDTYTFLNPRRSDWDSEWKQGIEEPQFYQQVTWELDALDKATHIVMFLEPGTKSPISLLELGLYAATGKLLVVCPEGFWRKGNVDIVCNRYGVLQFPNLDSVVEYLAAEICT